MKVFLNDKNEYSIIADFQGVKNVKSEYIPQGKLCGRKLRKISTTTE